MTEQRGPIVFGDKTTADVPHKMFSAGDTTYFACRYPEGDWCVHEHRRRDQHGYGGDDVSFLLEDGSIRTVKGPYFRTGAYEHGQTVLLANYFGISSIAVKAYRLTVGRNLWAYSQGPKEIVYSELEWILGDWLPRVRSEWAGLELQIQMRSGSRFRDVDSVLKERSDCKHRTTPPVSDTESELAQQDREL